MFSQVFPLGSGHIQLRTPFRRQLLRQTMQKCRYRYRHPQLHHLVLLYLQ